MLACLPAAGLGNYPFRFGSVGQEYGKAIAVDRSSNVLCAALFMNSIDVDPSPASFTLVSTGMVDIVIAKYDRFANLLWAGRMGGPLSTEAPHGIEADAADNVYICGYFGNDNGPSRTADFDPGPGSAPLVSQGGYDVYVAKYSAAGGYLWARGLGNASATTEERAWDIAVDAQGYAYVAGAITGTVNFGNSSVVCQGSGHNLFLAKYAPDGSNCWAFAVPANIQSVFNEGYTAIDLTGDGRLFFAGNFRGTCDFDPGAGTSNLTSAGGTDIFIGCYDTNGVFAWVRRVGGASQDILSPGALRTDGSNIFATGRFAGTCDFDPGPAVSNITSSGGNNIFVASCTGNGALRWAFNVPTTTTTGSQGGHRVAVDRAARVLVAGWFTGGADFNPAGPVTFAITNHGAGADVFLAQYTYNGAFNWVRGFGATNTPPSPDNNIAAGLALDDDDNAYINGQCFGVNADFDPGPGEALLSSAGDNDCFVAQYSSAGWLVVPEPAALLVVVWIMLRMTIGRAHDTTQR